MKMHVRFAVLLTATCTLSTVAIGQKTVYRCGASYSQIPCEGAVPIHADDARTKSAKTEADKSTQRAMKQAEEMEKTRLKEEKAALEPRQKPAAPADKAKPDATAREDESKKSRHKKKEPEYFTAKPPPEKKQP